jgi:hypothetical protein
MALARNNAGLKLDIRIRNEVHTRRTTAGFVDWMFWRMLCHGLYFRSASEVYGPLIICIEKDELSSVFDLRRLPSDKGDSFIGGICFTSV